MFREPEPRPAAIISTVFTGLVLSPLLVMLILWAKVGINVRQFPISLSGIGFLAGIGGERSARTDPTRRDCPI